MGGAEGFMQDAGGGNYMLRASGPHLKANTRLAGYAHCVAQGHLSLVLLDTDP